MAAPDTLRSTRIPLNRGSGAIPAAGFGALIHAPAGRVTEPLEPGLRRKLDIQ